MQPKKQFLKIFLLTLLLIISSATFVSALTNRECQTQNPKTNVWPIGYYKCLGDNILPVYVTKANTLK